MLRLHSASTAVVAIEASETFDMKNIRMAWWALWLVVTGACLLADTLWPRPWNYFAFRDVAVQFTGVLAIAAMSVALVLAARLHWLERRLAPLNQMYRLHKWLGILALAAGVAHGWLIRGSMWMVNWGWLARPEDGVQLPLEDGALPSWLAGQRDLAESLGGWAFYGAAILLAAALIRRIPYHWFAKIHPLMSVVYLALALHTVALLKPAYWTQPLGWLTALLLAAGTAAALWTLAGRAGARRTVGGEVVATHDFAPLSVLRVTVAMPADWPGHAPGQFAFLTNHPNEDPHPYTIVSAWDSARRDVTFLIKALGDHTATLPRTLRAGLPVRVQGPYGRFTFDDDAPRQIWVGAGIGLAPFLSRMEHRTNERAAGSATPQPEVDLFYATSKEDPLMHAVLRERARLAGVTMHILVDGRDERLTPERLRAAVPGWRQASLWFCGPPGFGQTLRRDFTARGLPKERFHQELFEMR